MGSNPTEANSIQINTIMDNFNNFEDEVLVAKLQEIISRIIAESEKHKQNSILLMMVAE